MKLSPIAVQLYTVREALANDFTGVVKKIAEFGYLGVETANFPGTTPKQAAQLFKDLGLTVCSAHAPLPIGPQKNEVLDLAATLNCSRVICPALDRAYYSRVDQVHRACDLINEANQVAIENGLSLGVHNHWWEYEPVEDQYPYEIMMERLDPSVFMEIDVYWVRVAGFNPVEIVEKWGQRAPLLHIKDGTALPGLPHLAVGEGIIDIAGVIEAGKGVTEWLIVELDECETDMLEAVEDSYTYLVGSSLARGRKLV
ncbi:MAG: sugar phosphate isomerase/epimerase [Anaerolineales bacterium]|nr:sugar phosphate isomerase/epimerase [Anaerolineales bacterium]